jgi:hypothetical protein
MGTRMLIAFVGSCRVCYDGLVELFAEFAAGFCDPAFGFFAKFEGGGSVLNGSDGFAGVVFEIAQERFEF